MSSEWFNTNYYKIFPEYSEDELIRDVEAYIGGEQNGLRKILNKFFLKTMYQCKGGYYKQSPIEVLMDDDSVKAIIGYTKRNTEFFNQGEIANVKSFLRNTAHGGLGLDVRIVSNFPTREAERLYSYYYGSIYGLDCLDPCMGFGARMSAVLLSGGNYTGFDMNPNVIENSWKLYEWYIEHGFVNRFQTFDIGLRDFAVTVNDYYNCFDVIMTSPPYGSMEKYYDDIGSSTRNYGNFSKWTEEFVIPFTQNCYKYLKVGGYCEVNIKNSYKKREPCYDVFFDGFSNIDGLEFVEVLNMKLRSKRNYDKYWKDIYSTYENKSKEPVMVFKKVK